MNKKIKIEIGAGIIVVLAIIIGMEFWIVGRSNTKVGPSPAKTEVAMEVKPTEVENSVATADNANSLPKNYQDDVVAWYDSPKVITNFKFLKRGEDNPIKTWEVGVFKSGDYKDKKLILMAFDNQNPGGISIYRFVKADDGLRLLDKYSSDNFFTSYDEKDLNDKTFDLMYKTDPGGVKINSLEYPGMIFSPDGRKLVKQGDFAFFYDIADATFSDVLLKKVFTDRVYGDVFMTDASKVNADNANSIFAKNGFYVKAPDGTYRVYNLSFDFMANGEIPDITWNDGNKNKDPYSFKGSSGCGVSGYADVVDKDIVMTDLAVAGKTSDGGDIYYYADSNAKYLKDWFAEDKAGVNDGYDIKVKKDTTYDQFLAMHPVFFVKDQFGRLIRFLNSNLLMVGGCGKPVIYLYPQKTENVSVRINPTGGMRVSDPSYDGGWNVLAYQNSNLKNLADGKTYPYLFWEGKGDSIYEMPNYGFVASRDNLENLLDQKLAQEGLSQKESADFKEFWLPRMLAENKPYYFVTFVARNVIDELAPLNITPKPDTTIRVLMDYKGLDNWIDAPSFDIKTPARNGFTAVEWGGVLR